MGSFAFGNRVFVLGAGASAFAGYPLANGLLAFVRNYNFTEARTKEAASRVVGKLSDAESQFSRHIVRNPDGTDNLEALLTYLDLYRSFPGTIFDLNPWTLADSADIKRILTYRFLEHQYDLNKTIFRSGVANGAIAKMFEAWPRLFRPGDIVLTFNWDLLHEVILWQKGLWSYRNGYGFECSKLGQREGTSQVLMLKLHGSVNWVQRDDGDDVSYIADVKAFFPESEDWDWRPRYDEAQSDSGRKLILPTYLKDISSSKPLLETWTIAHGALREAKELVVVGYSLNPVDHPARLLFGTALAENPCLSHVTVVSPDNTEWTGFLGRMNKQVLPVKKRFEDWVLESS